MTCSSHAKLASSWKTNNPTSTNSWQENSRDIKETRIVVQLINQWRFNQQFKIVWQLLPFFGHPDHNHAIGEHIHEVISLFDWGQKRQGLFSMHHDASLTKDSRYVKPHRSLPTSKNDLNKLMIINYLNNIQTRHSYFRSLRRHDPTNIYLQRC
jgi:hypothetical protein